MVGMGERRGSKCFPLDLTPSTARGGGDRKAEDRAFSSDSQKWADLSQSLLDLSPGVPLIPLDHDISSLTAKGIGKPREKGLQKKRIERLQTQLFHLPAGD